MIPLAEQSLEQRIKNLEEKSIAETITNENGTAIKFSDGTMICKTSFSKEKFLAESDTILTVQDLKIYISSYVGWDYPVPFIDNNINIAISYQTNFNGSRTLWHRINVLQPRLTQFQLLSLESFTQNGNGYNMIGSVMITAIGRWK